MGRAGNPGALFMDDWLPSWVLTEAGTLLPTPLSGWSEGHLCGNPPSELTDTAVWAGQPCTKREAGGRESHIHLWVLANG